MPKFMRKSKPFAKHLNVRVGKETFIALHKKAQADGGVSDVVREMIAAYLDGRMFIKQKPASFNQPTE